MRAVGRSSTAKTLGVHARNEIIELIERRAEALGWSKSKYTEAILEKWMEEGAPAVNEYERVAIQVAPKRRTA